MYDEINNCNNILDEPNLCLELLLERKESGSSIDDRLLERSELEIELLLYFRAVRLEVLREGDGAFRDSMSLLRELGSEDFGGDGVVEVICDDRILR